MLRRLWAWLRGESRSDPEPTALPAEPAEPPLEATGDAPPPETAGDTPVAPIKTMPPGTVTLIHDDGTVSSLPDPDQSSITYVVDELLAAQGPSGQAEQDSRED
jgi:hypothetical protein